jgi:shikimate kinase
MNHHTLSHHKNAPIFLVGFMGAGKTTVGRTLAEYLEYDFLDLDELIEARAGKSVQAIFAELGEAEFRRLEHQAIRECGDRSRAVIALGGGAYVPDENRTLLRTIGRTVWLDCPLDICLRRIGGDTSRPLLGDADPMRELLEARRPAYAEADYVVQTADLSPEQLVIEIANLLDN